jgi:hypothetical protein
MQASKWDLPSMVLQLPLLKEMHAETRFARIVTFAIFVPNVQDLRHEREP